MWYFIVPTQPIQYTPPNAHQRQSSPSHFSHLPISLSPALYPTLHLLRRKQRILIPQKLPTIRLPKRRNARRIQPSRLLGAPRRDPEPERRIVHAVDDDALVLRAVL